MLHDQRSWDKARFLVCATDILIHVRIPHNVFSRGVINCWMTQSSKYQERQLMYSNFDD